MRINPPTLFWLLIAAIVAVDRFFPVVAFDEPWLPWSGAGEENAMRRTFGDPCDAHRRRVGRWIGRRRSEVAPHG